MFVGKKEGSRRKPRKRKSKTELTNIVEGRRPFKGLRPFCLLASFPQALGTFGRITIDAGSQTGMEDLYRETKQLLGISLSPFQLSLVEEYGKELEKWNERYSLTAISDPEKVRIKHFLDSFSSLLVMKNTPLQRLIDIGTGAGFPGIPLKILLPESEVVLVDSVSKKTDFCQHIVDHLELSGVEVIHARVEKLAREETYREKFDWAIARAVAQLPTLSEYMLPFVKIGGKMLAMKGDQGPAETQNASQAVSLLGGELEQVKRLTLPGVTEDRYLITIGKMASTPEKYPRRVGMPSKRPL
jgi:16S rRNA (guanine527-N7)-methyltransferase